MLILKLITCLLIFFIVPILLGMLVTRFTNKKDNILYSFIIGFFIQFAILQIIAIPMIFLSCKFTTLLYIWSFIIGILSVISIILNKSLIKKLKVSNLKNIFNKSNIICVVAILFVLLQACYPMLYTYTNEDDAFFVGTAATTIYENSMYKVSAESGGKYKNIPARYVLAPFPIYLAVVSEIVHMSPTIVAHTIFPPIFIILAYAIYTLLGEKLFGKDKTNISIFIILLSIVHIFGNYSDRTNFTYLLLRIWQGKAILSSIILPALWLLFLNCIENSKKIINWVYLLMVVLSGCLVSEMGIALVPITLMLLSFVFAIKDKKISYLLKSFGCIIPCIIYFMIYIFIK